MSDATAAGATARQYEFKTEVKKMLHIITHSLYTHREIFLRELVSNASDALDKLRFAQSKGQDIPSPDLPLEITITLDKDAGVLTIADTGIGMTEEELVDNIGTIARSGSEQFLNTLAQANGADKADASAIIGRFGVGFYSVFMVADEVVIETRAAREGAEAVRWVSDGAGSFTVEAAQNPPVRGTVIHATLKDDAKEYVDKGIVEGVLKKHSSFIGFPILVEGDKVNTIPALWREPKFQVTEEQYKEFYSFLTFDPEAPLCTIHTAVDAPVQFNSLIFIPSQSFDMFGFDRSKYGLDLYVRRVLIQRENKDLIPEWLGFAKGVVDTEDLPLNISRETLQENVVLRKIGATVTKQILSHLEKLAKDKPEEYAAFWKAHGKAFKMGHADYAHREAFGALVRFNATIHDDASGLTSLDDYIARAKEGQKDIYYVSGPSVAATKLNPHMEILRRKGVEVLRLFEPLDEFVMDTLRTYKDFALTSVEHADAAKLEELPDVEEASRKVEPLDESGEKGMAALLERMRAILGGRVTEVRLSKRLADSACCLTNPDGGMTSAMEKIIRTVSRDATPPRKAMEINADHPLVRDLMKIHAADADDAYVATATEQLYESALLLEGYLADPHRMVERINTLLEQAGGWYAAVKKL
ncbi:MAG: molecular chaperone HtpG [Desulfovibrionaceae bacterium]